MKVCVKVTVFSFVFGVVSVSCWAVRLGVGVRAGVGGWGVGEGRGAPFLSLWRVCRGLPGESL